LPKGKNWKNEELLSFSSEGGKKKKKNPEGRRPHASIKKPPRWEDPAGRHPPKKGEKGGGTKKKKKKRKKKNWQRKKRKKIFKDPKKDRDARCALYEQNEGREKKKKEGLGDKERASPPANRLERKPLHLFPPQSPTRKAEALAPPPASTCGGKGRGKKMVVGRGGDRAAVIGFLSQ